METAVGFLHVDFLTQYPFMWVVPPKVVDQMEEIEYGMAKSDTQEFFLSNSLVDGLAFFPVE